MNALRTILLIVLTQTTLVSQEFAPIGAIWHIQVAEPFAPEWSGTLTNESIRDTILKEMSCKVIFKSQPTIFNEIHGEYILCQNGDSIFHYIESIDSMNLVMDFGAGIGQSWESFDRSGEYESFGTQRNYKYTVDSISYLNLNDQDSLRIQHLTVLQKQWSQPDSEYYWDRQTDQLIEKLGFQSALLPSNGGDGFTDDQFETDIRCYQDNKIGLVKLTEDENCITTSTININNSSFNIHPNPTSGILKIEGLEKLNNALVVVFDCQANILLKAKNTNQVNLEHLNNGLYYIQIRSNEIIFTQRIVLLK